MLFINSYFENNNDKTQRFLSASERSFKCRLYFVHV